MGRWLDRVRAGIGATHDVMSPSAPENVDDMNDIRHTLGSMREAEPAPARERGDEEGSRTTPDGGTTVEEQMRKVGMVPNPNGPGWVLTPEGAATCIYHPDRPHLPDDRLFCGTCRRTIRSAVDAARAPAEEPD